VSRLKQVLGLLGMLAGVAGIALQNRSLVWIAIGFLGASIVARMLVSMRERRAGSEGNGKTDSPD
jgi:hypothetical protein